MGGRAPAALAPLRLWCGHGRGRPGRSGRAGAVRPARRGDRGLSVPGPASAGRRTAGLLAEVFGTPMSVGTVAAWTSRAAAGLEPFTAAARAALTSAELVH